MTQKYSPTVVKEMESDIREVVSELIDKRLPESKSKFAESALDLAFGIRNIGNHLDSTHILDLADQLRVVAFQAVLLCYSSELEEAHACNDHAKVQELSEKMNGLIDGFFIVSQDSHMSGSDKEKILTQLLQVEESFTKVGILDEESPLSQAVASLKKELGVETLKKEGKSEKKSSPAFNALRDKFEGGAHLSSNSLPIQKPKLPPKKTPSLEEKQELFKEKLQSKLSKLDEMSLTDRLGLLSSLRENKALFSKEDQLGIDELILALEMLQKPELFKPSPVEIMLIEEREASLAPYGIDRESYEQASQLVQKELQKELIAKIKDNRHSLSALGQCLAKERRELEPKAIVRRLKGAVVSGKETKRLTNTLAINWGNLVIHVQGFQKEAKDHFWVQWTQVLTKFDQETGGKFSQFIQDLGYCNLGKNVDVIISSLTQKYFQEFVTSELFEKALQKTAEDFRKELIALQEEEPRFYREENGKHYQGVRPYLIWIRDHIHSIQKVYDQGDDLNRNMGKGTCERNCEDRVKLLLKEPRTPSDQIKMGSTETGRFNQAMRGALFDLKDDRPEEAMKLLSQSYDRIGLKVDHYERVAIKKNQNPQEQLYYRIAELAAEEKGSTLFILGMEKEGGEGHAINIQIDLLDLSMPVFRFIDDNLGVVESSHGDEFYKVLTTWLKISYPDLTNYTLMTLTALPVNH